MNPFKPTAGKMPPYLIGREEAIAEFDEGLRNGAGAPGLLMRVSGARGMGKTVLLAEFRRMAFGVGWNVVSESAQPGFCDRIYQQLQPNVRVSGVQAGLRVFGASGSADLARKDLDLRESMRAVALANGDGKGLLITLDEVQDAPLAELQTLAHAVQHLISDDIEISFVFAGLPSMERTALHGQTLTFLRRALPVHISAIDVGDVAWSLEDTFEETGVAVGEGLVQQMAAATRGYPYMVQLVGYYCWQAAERNGMVLDSAGCEQGISRARSRFDAAVIEPALQHLSPRQMRYLHAMAQDEGRISNSGEIAKRIGCSQTSASSVRESLIRANVIESPRWGALQFVIPYMWEYLH